MSDNIPGTLSCINARDKFECMTLIDKDEADIVNLDAEDLYLGGRLYDLEPFAMEEHNGNIYLQRSAVIVPRRSRIGSIHELKGKRACLGAITDVHRWSVPVGILLAAETMVPDCRGELHTVSRYFADSCAAGNWSSDSQLDQQLKRSVPRLCSLCKDPFTPCSPNDLFGGADGSLKCLVEGGRGEVAFTTVEIAVDYFARRADERDHYELLCLDGSRMAVTARGCDWAKHPTNAFVIRKNRERNKEIYLRILQQIFARFVKLRPAWFDKAFVSSTNVTQIVHMPVQQSRWNKYLEFYEPSIVKPLQGCARRNVTFCLHRDGELSKCQRLQKAAFARRIRPTIRCMEADSESTCIRMLAERRADLLVMSPDRYYHWASRGASGHRLRAIAIEHSRQPTYAVAVVKSNSDITTFEQLRGRRSCHTSFGDIASWIAPIGRLLERDAVEPIGCNRATVITQYFSGGSCAPGAADARINANGTAVRELCSQCIGDAAGRHVCESNSGERYVGESGALRCLADGRGDVAFVRHDTIAKFADGRSSQSWTSTLKTSDFRLLCASSGADSNSAMGRRSYDDILSTDDRNRRAAAAIFTSHALPTDYARCHIARIPDPLIVTSAFTPLEARIDAALMLDRLSGSFFGPHRDSFRAAGVFRNRSDLIFADNAQSLRIMPRAIAGNDLDFDPNYDYQSGDSSQFRDALGDFLPILQRNDMFACASASSAVIIGAFSNFGSKFLAILPLTLSIFTAKQLLK